MALNPAIIHSMHVCTTCTTVEMQTHIACRWGGSAPFVTSLTRVRVWTQLINTKRCQRALESAAFSWSRDSDVFVFLFPSHLVRPHQERSSAMLWHVQSRPPCLTLHLPLPSLPITQERVRDSFMSGDDSTLHWSVHVGDETLFIQSKLPLTAQIYSKWEFHTSLSYFLSISPISGVNFVSQL